MPSLIATLSSGLAGALALPVLAVAGLGGGSNPACTATVSAGTVAGPVRDAPEWNAEQQANVRTIVTIGQARGVPAWGWVVAVATAMQESGLRNLSGGDRDSIGLFQQRPSQGWGSPTQLRNPAYQSERFFQALHAVEGWQQLPLTVAAQAVQRSAYPDAYARWTDDALALVTAVAAGAGTALPADPRILQRTATTTCLPDGGDGLPTGVGATEAKLPPGFTVPPGTPPAAALAVMWGLAQLGTPYRYGGDCTDPQGPDPTRHCDCSSLVQVAYRHAGITLPRTTTDQVRAGVPVTGATHLRPGDLVFIPGSNGTTATPRHVGLYLGPDQAGHGLVLHAPRTGDHVKVAHLDSWRPLAAIRRIITTP